MVLHHFGLCTPPIFCIWILRHFKSRFTYSFPSKKIRCWQNCPAPLPRTCRLSERNHDLKYTSHLFYNCLLVSNFLQIVAKSEESAHAFQWLIHYLHEFSKPGRAFFVTLLFYDQKIVMLWISSEYNNNPILCKKLSKTNYFKLLFLLA